MVFKLVLETHLPFLGVFRSFSLYFFFNNSSNLFCAKFVWIKVFQNKHLKMSFLSSRVHLGRHSSVHLGRHNSNELYHIIHSEIPFFGEDIGPISFRDLMEKFVQLLFSKYSQIDILKHVTSRFIGHVFDCWQER